ncbi:MAG: peptidoglycan-binding protein [Chthoniobacterales bacterium]|nr:peptidoglycan-binding protein [Chthoniobacterales bacterium]
MKKFISLLIGCSLALAGAAMAQQPDEKSSPAKKKRQNAEQTKGAEAKPDAKASKSQERPARQNAEAKEGGEATERGATNERDPGKGGKARTNEEPSSATGTDASGQAIASETPGAAKQQQQQTEQRKKGMKERDAANAKASATPAAAAASATPAAASASAAPPVKAADQQNAQAKAGAKKKPDPQQVQQIKAQNANFRAQARPQQVPTVTFNENYRIQGAERWQGPQYEVFRAYRPERHDEGWYRSRYSRVELIGGGYYYWNNNYWYPAWGYNPSAQYYAYDGPIYVGQRAEPPDRVIADVQGVLQQMGYYRGEVDGLLGPLTREALTAYQSEQGLMATAVIDQPTLDSLGMG